MRAWVAVLLVLVACGGTHPPLRHSEQPARPLPAGTVRVGLLVGVQQASFASPSTIEILDANGASLARIGGTRLVASQEDGRVVVRRGSSVVCTGPPRTTLRARTGGEWSVKDDQFAGDLLLHPGQGPTITLVNHLGVEEYLRGVVPWEIGRPEVAALEAVKAQAIAARTYTYGHLRHWEALGFDLYDSVADQVYRGRTGTHELTDRAIRETRDQVVTYDGKLIRAYYSSTCGGHGSTLSDVWTREPAPYLSGARDAEDHAAASWCKGSSQFRWSEAWSARELGDIVRAHLPGEIGVAADSIGALTNLEVLERDASGRVKRLAIATTRGTFELFGDRIRWVLRPVRGRFGILRSTLFNLEVVRDREGVMVALRLSGGGFGHGVGLCQTGALGMARAGLSARDILEHYYRGARVVSSDEGALAR